MTPAKEWLALDDTDQDEQAKAEHLARYKHVLEAVRGRNVLDLGCGAGYGAAAMADVAKLVCGIDRRLEAVQYARQHHAKPNVAFLTRDIRDLNDGKARWYDVVTAFEVLEHMEDPRDLLEVARGSAPDGILYLSTPFYTRTVHVAPADAMATFGNAWHLHAWDAPGLWELLHPYFADVQIGTQYRLEFHDRVMPAGTSWFITCREPVP